MAKIKHKNVKFSPEEMAYELPAELDIKKLRRVGSGVKTVKRLAERSRRTIGLDPDVAKVFPDSEAVNGMLRAIISSLPR
jgi:hypothetical protein